MKCQRFSESEALHDIGEVFLFTRIEWCVRRRTDRVIYSLLKCILKPFKFLASNLDIHFI